MSTQTQSLPPLGPQDLARISTLYAHSAAKIGGTDYQQEVDRFLAWVLGIQREAAKPLERLVQDLENELAETEGRIVALQEEAWDRGYRKHAVFGPGYSATNPYRAGGDAK